MIAAIAMYDMPELRPWLVRWWAAIRREMAANGIADAPKELSFDAALDGSWRAQRTFLRQTCGYPLITGLVGPVAVLGTPGYAAEGCDGSRYCSLILVREAAALAALEDLRGTVCVFNAPHSHSGYNAMRAAIAAVRRAEADACAADCVTVALLAR